MTASHQLFENNAGSTVNGTIAVGAGFFNVAAGHGSRFPTPGAGQYFEVTVFERDVAGAEINFEVMKVTSIAGDTLTVIRDFEGMVASAGGTSGGWAFPSAPGVNPSQIVYVQMRYTAFAAGNNLTKDGGLEGIEDAALARASLGLGNVDNTADAAKPVSAAQQAALNLKAPSSASTAAGTSNAPAGNISAVTVQAAINELDEDKQPRDANLVSAAPGALGDVLVWDGSKWVGQASSEDTYAFSKADSTTPAFTKTGASTLSVKAGSSAKVSGVKVSWPVATAVTMPALTGGTDYAIYACADGSLRADPNWSAPTGYTTANSRKIGGFHYGLVAAGTTVAGGSFNAAGSPTTGGMVWTQPDVDKIAGINEFSLWDLKFRPACADPRGMVLVNGRTWVDIYLCSTDTAANGTSKAGSNIASGAVLPKIPAAFGGNGTLAYGALNWWVANELARANKKRLMLASEFYDAAFGVTDNQSIDATTSTYPVTQRNPGYTSRYGIEQAAGVHWIWGQDSAGSASAYVANGGRGQSCNNSIVRVVLGGSRADGSGSGSRCSYWGLVSSSSNWNFGLRAASDHLQLV